MALDQLRAFLRRLQWNGKTRTPLPGITMADPCFRFEADFSADLRCIPMAVRRKLDLAGVKLKLVHWAELSQGERQELVDWPDDAEGIAALHGWLLERTAAMAGGGRPGSCPRPWISPGSRGGAGPRCCSNPARSWV